MKLTKTASGKQYLKITKAEWQKIGQQTGWENTGWGKGSSQVLPQARAKLINELAEAVMQEPQKFRQMLNTLNDSILLEIKKFLIGPPLLQPVSDPYGTRSKTKEQ